jgi:hypothetical protein
MAIVPPTELIHVRNENCLKRGRFEAELQAKPSSLQVANRKRFLASACAAGSFTPWPAALFCLVNCG